MPSDSSRSVTELLDAWGRGNRAALDALDGLAKHDPRKPRVVELRSFVGLSIEETAQAVESSPATIKREWTAARAWRRRELTPA